jgi:hypothetical protein
LITFRTTRGHTLVATTLLGILMAGSVSEKAIFLWRFSHDRDRPSTLRTMLQDQPADLAIAVDDPLRCLESAFYESPAIASRLLYPVDAEGSRQYGGFYYPGKTWLELASFRTRHRRYLVYSTAAAITFLVPKLVADGADVRTVGAVGVERLYLVTERSPQVQTSGGASADGR